MSDLIVIGYDDEHRAGEVLATLRRLSSEYLIDMDDAVYVTKDVEGKVKLHQSVDLTTAGAASGGFWGLLVGLLFFAPVVGAAVGAGVGALAGKLSDYGLDDNFARQLSERLKPGSSAIFLLVRKVTPEKVVPEVAKFGGTVMHTSLSPESEAKLQAALMPSAVAPQSSS